jgi:hypothetical protein
MWIITAWQHILPEMTVKVFRKCCTSCAVDGTADGVTLWVLGSAVHPVQWMELLMVIYSGL